MNNFESGFSEYTPDEEKTDHTPEQLLNHIETDVPEKNYTQIVTDTINSSIRENPETREQTPFKDEQIDQIVQEHKEKPENLTKIQEHLGIFKDCNDWKEVGNKVGKAVIEWQKERMLIGLVVAGVVVAVVEPTPIMEFLVGPALVTVGWEHSKYLKKIVPKEVVTRFMRIDPVKAFKK